MEHLCQKWPRICSICHNPLLWLFTGFWIKIARRVISMKQELITIHDNLTQCSNTLKECKETYIKYRNHSIINLHEIKILYFRYQYAELKRLFTELVTLKSGWFLWPRVWSVFRGSTVVIMLLSFMFLCILFFIFSFCLPSWYLQTFLHSDYCFFIWNL